MGIYAGKSDSLDNLPDGASVAVPNDATNEGRALLLLEAQGLIKLADDSNLSSTPKDIVENPKNLTFTEVEAATIPSIASEVDLAVINSNYALGAGPVSYTHLDVYKRQVQHPDVFPVIIRDFFHAIPPFLEVVCAGNQILWQKGTDPQRSVPQSVEKVRLELGFF